MNLASIVAVLKLVFTKLGPAISWLATNYGTYSTIIGAVLAALASIAAGNTVSGVQQLAQILVVLLTGGAVTGLAMRMHAAEKEARSLRMTMVRRSKDAD